MLHSLPRMIASRDLIHLGLVGSLLLAACVAETARVAPADAAQLVAAGLPVRPVAAPAKK